MPNGTEKADIQRGKMVAESAIRSLVASWEGGYRNPLVYSAASAAVVSEDSLKIKEDVDVDVVGAVSADGDGHGFEDRGTGDAIRSSRDVT